MGRRPHFVTSIKVAKVNADSDLFWFQNYRFIAGVILGISRNCKPLNRRNQTLDLR